MIPEVRKRGVYELPFQSRDGSGMLVAVTRDGHWAATFVVADRRRREELEAMAWRVLELQDPDRRGRLEIV